MSQSMSRIRRGPALSLGLVLALVGFAAVCQIVRVRAGGDLDLYGPTALLGAVMGVCALVTLSSGRGRTVGVVLMGFASLWAFDGALEAWYGLGVTPPFGTEADPLPGVAFASWFVGRAGAFLLVGLPLLLVLYPTGRMVGGPWRVLGVLTVAASALLPAVLLVTPSAVLGLEGSDTVVSDLDLLSLPIPESVGVPLLTASRTITLGAVLPALVLVGVRHQRSSGVERRQLRWLLWAAIVCLFLLVVTLLMPSGHLASWALFAAVAVTSVSVTVGICAPERFDVDGLVADTLAWGTVAAIVVGLDLVVVGLAGRLFGEAFSRQDGMLAALLLAVLLYAPLRSLVWVRVRRVLLGRRGDRYQVVAGLAARLESSGAVADQLPALASAVADSFRLAYVGVEVVRADGVTLVAEHGRRPERVAELPIAYSGQEVGRLTLPARGGFRSLLTRADQALMMDVVRQAAIAVRLATLTDELQASRERLVVAREDDRRRIRRDLHDGLGPVLGGVGLRLAAASAALDADPERAKALIAVSRTDLTDAVTEVRRLVHGLRPPTLDDLGLVAAIEQQADLLRAADVQVSVELIGAGDAEGVGGGAGSDATRTAGPGEAGAERGLSAAVEVAAYRIVAESLTNVGKHAQARRVDVRLTRRDTTLDVEVADDGVGISLERSAGVGLLSVRERAAELGGQASVSCPPGGGTTVRAVLPLTGGDS